MGLLAELIAETEGQDVANPAKVANLGPVLMPIFADSQDSPGLQPTSTASSAIPMTTVEVRTRLLAAASTTWTAGWCRRCPSQNYEPSPSNWPSAKWPTTTTSCGDTCTR